MKKILFLTHQIYLLFADFLYDFVRYIRHSMFLRVDTFEKLESRIMAHAHVIEKGLALPNTRNEFGKDIILRLIGLLNIYIKQNHDLENFAFQSSIVVLSDYKKYHQEQGISIPDLFKKIDKLLVYRQSKHDSVRFIKEAELKKAIKGDYQMLVKARHSIRSFLEKDVEVRTLKNAVKLALTTPSVCNRQSWKVYATQNKKLMKNILAQQTGNRGFGDKIPALLIVTGDLNTFQGFQERNQVYVDGGLFSMNLIHSLFYYNLGTCPLNWSSHYDKDIEIRKFVPIPPNESIILLLAVGYLPDTIKITASIRKSVDDTLVVFK